MLIPIGTTAATIAAAARAVEWDAGEALRTAGFTSDEVPRPIPTAGLDRFSDDELLAEVRKRMRSAAAPFVASSPAATPAPGATVDDEPPTKPHLRAVARATDPEAGKGRPEQGEAPDGGA